MPVLQCIFKICKVWKDLKFYVRTRACQKRESGKQPLGPVHTYADIFKNGCFFLRFAVASTRKRRFRHAKTEVFKNALQSGGFRKRRFCVYVWTGENEDFRKR